MRRPWQIWLLFFICLALVLPGMAWLSLKLLQLDRAEADAQRVAERQEQIAAALWRMDWMLTPMIAQEAARPSYHYHSFLPAEHLPAGKGAQPATPSPLLLAPPDYVLLYFEVDSARHWTSPQIPEGRGSETAVRLAAATPTVQRNRLRLSQLRQAVSYEELLSLLPETLLPSVDLANFAPELRRGWLDAMPLDAPATTPTPPVSAGTEVTGPSGQGSENQVDSPLASQVPAQQFAADLQESLASSSTPPSQRRAEDEFARRNRGVQNMARSQRVQQLSNTAFLSPQPTVREGVSRPVWIGDRLLLARRVVQGHDTRLQGCWLDWRQIEQTLRLEIADLLPSVQLQPVRADGDAQPGRLLATLPVQLTNIDWPADEANSAAPTSAVRLALIIAWCCFLLAAIAVVVVLRSVISLSERRAAFVSAVTHELRTPLTTFRMYSEMLSAGMVTSRQQQQSYLDTLCVEADRLAHLVDNVLQYARLERGARVKRCTDVELGTLRQRCEDRLRQRAAQADMQLQSTLADIDASAVVHTDPAAVEQILFNLVDNACKYAASARDRNVTLRWTANRRHARIRVSDHGPGIPPEQARTLFEPFSKSDQEAACTAPGIGLGLALCRRLASDLRGRLAYIPGEQGGAVFELTLPLKRHASTRESGPSE